MAASSTDFFTKVGAPGSATTLAAPGHTIGGTSITVGSTANWATTTGQIFAMDTVSIVNGKEVRDANSYTEWEGIVTGSTTVGSLVLRYGTDRNYPAGSTTRVYIPVASSRENRLIDGILAEHTQAGIHNAAAAASIAANLPSGSIPAAALATSAITLGYAQITSNFVSASSTAVQVTGLTASVTIPAGGRRIKITAWCQSAQTSGVFNTFVSIWDGTPGTGTQLASTSAVSSSASFDVPHMAMAIVSPVAGAKTYNVGFKVSGATGTLNASATAPAFILVEAI